jgi:hypothetical protein
MTSGPFGRDPFARADPSDDAIFYVPERRVVHIEAGAIEALRAVYAAVIPAGSRVLDLMSSWRSHLPDGLGPVTGLGMNGAEIGRRRCPSPTPASTPWCAL